MSVLIWTKAMEVPVEEGKVAITRWCAYELVLKREPDHKWAWAWACISFDAVKDEGSRRGAAQNMQRVCCFVEERYLISQKWKHSFLSTNVAILAICLWKL